MWLTACPTPGLFGSPLAGSILLAQRQPRSGADTWRGLYRLEKEQPERYRYKPKTGGDCQMPYGKWKCFWLEVKREMSVDSFRCSEILMHIPAKGIDFKKDEGFAIGFGMLRKGSGYFIKPLLCFQEWNPFFFNRNPKFSPSHFPPTWALCVSCHAERSWPLASLGTAQFCSSAAQVSPFLNCFQQYHWLSGIAVRPPYIKSSNKDLNILYFASEKMPIPQVFSGLLQFMEQQKKFHLCFMRWRELRSKKIQLWNRNCPGEFIWPIPLPQKTGINCP